MKISAAILAAALLPAPAFTAAWAPEVSLENIKTTEVPAPAPAEIAGPRDGQNYSGAEELLIKEFAVTEIGLDIPESEVMRQNSFYANAFCFEHALRLALTALLENYETPTSPLARELAALGAPEKPSKSDLKRARQRLLDSLNKRESFLSMVHPYKQHQPLNGELVEKNWIFFLRLSGKSYWAVVDRSGEKAAYVYGMN
ncbi:MAG: hypothetical protein PHV33_04465 [Elusimicrobiales bacterium]|nr:hypothetical protein [Elusimicrobiales bacterium]